MEKPTTEEEVRVDEDEQSSSEEEVVVVEQWEDVVNAITKKSKEVFAAGPPFDATSPSAFQTYWRGVFTRLRESVSADPSIPRYLTEPPVNRFSITLFDAEHALNCPCCHPDVEPNILLENDGGVTKEDLLDGFTGYMYGDALPRVYIEPCSVFHKGVVTESDGFRLVPGGGGGEYSEEAGAVVYTISWMSGGTNEDGDKDAYSSEPNIVMYCCRQDEYESRRGSDEETEAPSPGPEARL